MNKKHFLVKIAAPLASLVFWILLWLLASVRVGSPLILPSPIQTFRRLGELASGAEFWRVCFASVLRILTGTLLGIAAGTVLGVLSAAFRPAAGLISPAVTVIKATPVASFIILAMLWLGRDSLPSFIAMLMVFPVLYQNVRTGIEEVPVERLMLRRVFELSRLQTLTKIYIPAVLPYFVSASLTALGLAWKAGIAAEVLAFSPDSIGRKLAESKNLLETADLFAWTAAVILFSLLFEMLFRRLTALLLSRRTGKEAPRRA